MGSVLGRRGDGEPGVNTLWRGYRRLEDVTAWGRSRTGQDNPFEDHAFRGLSSPRVGQRRGCRLPGHPRHPDDPRTPCAPRLSRCSRPAVRGHPPGSCRPF
jgi:hypothetical protein